MLTEASCDLFEFMSNQLHISFGQYSDKGRKALNQDYCSVRVPLGSQRDLKGVAIAMADGISSSEVSQEASQAVVQSFLEDYYCTSDAWSVPTSIDRVLSAANSWLYSKNQNSPYRYDKNRGYVCTLSVLVLKAATAFISHAGDTRLYRLNDDGLEQLSNDHRKWVSEHESFLSRALGVEPQCEFDTQTLQMNVGDHFILATDGIYEFAEAQHIIRTIKDHSDNLDGAAKRIADYAYDKGSDDNLSIQIVRVDALHEKETSEVQQLIDTLPFPPLLEPRMTFDGYTILRELYASSRSHVYAALDEATQKTVVIKIPSLDLREDPDYVERFLTEEWIARRINSANVLKADLQDRERNYLYTVSEYIEGQTLTQWMIDNPKPDVESVRGIIEQVAKGLMAFHRMDMLHQDLKPDNIMIESSGTVKIIDFGSVWVAGLAEQALADEGNDILGTALFTAPEYFLGESGTPRSDMFSLGIITYYMLSGRFPYGTKVSSARTITAQRRLKYQSVLDDDREIPAWVDAAINKAVSISAYRRYEDISEFLYDLRHPNQIYVNKTKPPLLERNPVAFWQGLSSILVLIIVYLLSR